MLSGALTADAGSIQLQGREIAGLAPYQICRMGVGRTFQIPRPIRRLSILENAALAGYYGQNRAVSREDAWRSAAEALRLVGLPSDSGATVDTLGAAGLKKLELAKALATKPTLLLADESLGGLDHSEMDQAADMLKNIREELGVTIVKDGLTGYDPDVEELHTFANSSLAQVASLKMLEIIERRARELGVTNVDTVGSGSTNSTSLAISIGSTFSGATTGVAITNPRSD